MNQYLAKTLLDKSDSRAETALRVVALLVLLFGFYAAYQNHSSQIQSLHTATRNGLETTITRIETQLNEQVLALRRMAERWQTAGGTPRRVWEADARNYFSDFKPYRAVSWFNALGISQWQIPHDSILIPADNQSHVEATQQSAMQQAQQTGNPSATHVYKLDSDQILFDIFVPITNGLEADGFIVGSINLINVLALVPQDQRDNFSFTLQQEQTSFTTASKNQTPASVNFSQQQKLQILNQAWNLTASPSIELIQRLTPPLPTIISIIAFLLSIIIVFIGRMVNSLVRQTQALELSHAQTNSILSSAYDGILIIDDDGIIDMANESSAQLFKTDPESMIGKPIADYILLESPTLPESQMDTEIFDDAIDLETGGESDENIASTYQKMRKLHELKTDHIAELQGIRQDGNNFPLEVCMSRAESNRAQCNILTLRDISLSKQHEEIEERLITIFDTHPDFIASFDLNGEIQYINEAGTKLLGIEPDSLQKELSLRSIFPAEEIDKLLNDAVPTAYLHKTWTGESKLLRGDGKTIDVMQRVVMHKSRLGGVRYFSTFMHDISAEKQAHLDSQREADRRILLANLLEVSFHAEDISGLLESSLAVMVHTPCLQTTKQGAIFLIQNHKLVMQTSINMGIREIDCKQLELGQCYCGKAGQGQPQFTPGGTVAEHIPGSPISKRGSYSIPISHEGKVLGVVHLCTQLGIEQNEEDMQLLISASSIIASAMVRLNAEEVLREHSSKLEQMVKQRTMELEIVAEKERLANEAKSEFLANMSHELRTPMHSILSFSGFGLKKADDVNREKLREYFERIQDSGSRLMNLLNDLLDLAKLESGRSSLELTRCCINNIIGHCLEEQEPGLQEKSLSVEYLAEAEEINASCDQHKISQVITNLLSNAIKFSFSGGEILVHLALEQRIIGRRKSDHKKVPTVVVTVSDHGIGIPRDELELVFDKFAQSSKTSTGAGGTGLGLAICKEIVESHQGQIWAEQNSGGGAKFTFTIPVEAKSI